MPTQLVNTEAGAQRMTMHPASCQSSLAAENETLRRALLESQRQFHSILMSLSGLFYRCELQAPWQMSFVSDGVFPLTGYEAEELVSHGWNDLILPEDRAPVDDAVALALIKDTSFDLSYRITQKGGAVRWVAERGHAVRDRWGKPLYLEGVISDISGRKEADQLQTTIAARWKKTLDAIPQMVWTMEADGSDEFYNAQWVRFTGCDIGHNNFDRGELIHADDRERALLIWKEKFQKGEPYETQYRLRHASGEYRWVLSRGEPERDTSGNVLRWYGTCTDIHHEVQGRQALQTSEAINRSMIEASPDCISLIDLQGRTKFLNLATLKALGLTDPGRLVGGSWAEAFPLSVRGEANLAISRAKACHTGRFTARQPGIGPDGTERWWDVLVAPVSDERGAPNGFISIARDITHQKTAEERVRWAADHDPLTMLPNRTLFQRTLDRALADARKTGGALTVLMLDLDNFKRTNDALGHDAGDALLVEFAARLRNAVRAEDMVARLGGDEFAVLLPEVGCEQQLAAVVDSIGASLKRPCEFDGKFMDIRTSVGASIFPCHGDCRAELLKHADIALYAAKSSGRGILKVFQASMRAEAQKRLSMLNLARDAIRDDKVLAYYQPKVDLRTGHLDGFEALLRWKNKRGVIQNADTIMAAFKDVTLAAEISEKVIGAVVSDLQRWADAGVEFGHVAINASAAEFRDGAFANKLLERLHRANLPTDFLQLEVTETVFLGRGAEHIQDALKALSAEGIQIALDDFGTGYASLSHLNHFPVDVIKIDRSFIQNLDTSNHDAAIVRGVINLGRSLGIRIVAEGIETQSQADFLKKHRCHSGQGFLFGKAMSASSTQVLANRWGKIDLVA